MNNIDSSYTSSNTRLDGIEILRGFAAVGVIFFHTWSIPLFQQKNQLIDIIMAHSALGVPLFFAISAFSLLYGYQERIFDEFSLKRFYIRRFFRLAPLFYILLIVYLIVAWVEWKATFDWATIFTNITFSYQLIPTQEGSLVWGGWTIGIEWIFYCLFPIVAIISRSKWISVISFIVLLIISIGFSPLTEKILQIDSNAGYMNSMKHMVYFFLGVVIFSYLPKIDKIRLKFPWLSKIDIFIVPIIAYLFYVTEPYIPKDVALCICFAILLIWAIIGYSHIFNNFFTRILGKISYGVYLMNPITVHYLEKMGVYNTIVNYTQNIYITFALSCAITFVCVIFASLVVYYTIEQPGIRLGQKMVDRMKGKQTVKLEENLSVAN